MVGHARRFYLGLMFSIMGFCLLCTAPSWASVQCGDTIGPNAVAFLTHDLNCSGFNPALTLEGNSILNLGGKTVDCQSNSSNGIQMTGSGSILQHGTVTGCFFGILVAGDGGHLVTKVTATSHSDGFFIDSDDNELRYTQSTNNSRNGYLLGGGQARSRNSFKENLARDNGSAGFSTNPGMTDNTFTKNQAIANGFHGFIIQGDRNQITGNLAKDNGQVTNQPGFQIRGSDNQVLSNTSIGNTTDGFFYIIASGNTALGNTAKQNGRNGIRLGMGAINNTLVGNVAKSNTGDDLFDSNANCDNNTWVGNRFRTSNQSCIH